MHEAQKRYGNRKDDPAINVQCPRLGTGLGEITCLRVVWTYEARRAPDEILSTERPDILSPTYGMTSHKYLHHQHLTLVLEHDPCMLD
jgi:hypothetical protein